MTVSMERTDWVPRKRRKTLEELLAEVDSKPMTMQGVAAWPVLFETEEEHEAFLAWLYEERRKYVI